MASKAPESPLIGHARIRALYRALVELRALAPDSLACLVGTAIDLADGDLISERDSQRDAVLLGHVRAVGQRPDAVAVTAATWKRLMKRLAEPAPEPFPAGTFERLLCAAGAAMALKTTATQTGIQTVALAYAGHGELSRNEWKRVFAVMGQAGLPLVLVALPIGEPTCDLEDVAVRSASSINKAVPVIPVDAGDAVAIYRVAQETLVRARAGGGAAVILGIQCGTDPVELLAKQLVAKGICTARWADGVKTHLSGLSGLTAAS
jgi:hypothetical protein